MEVDEKSLADERARQDLIDIGQLQRFEPFTRYFMRRLSEKMRAYETRFRNDPADKCSHEEREILRRIIKEYEEISVMMSREETTCKSQLARGVKVGGHPNVVHG
jgi:hypothetical protein